MKNDLIKLLFSFLSGLIASSKNGWDYTRKWIISFLKGELVKIALVKFLGSAMAGGIRGWIITLIVENLYEKFAEPIIEFGLRKSEYKYRRENGKIKITRLDKAELEGDDDAYDDAADSIFK